ncbi:hypothetical protein DVH24_000268, partial [Malus domestica]
FLEAEDFGLADEDYDGRFEVVSLCCKFCKRIGWVFSDRAITSASGSGLGSVILLGALIMRNALVIGFLILCIASSNFSIGRGLTTFNVLDYGALGDGKTDDSKVSFSSVYAPFLKAWNVSCVQTQGISSTLEIPANKTFLLQPTKFSGPCKSSSVHVQILGKIVAPSNLDAWSAAANHG